MEDPENSIAEFRARVNVMTALLCDSMAEVERLRARVTELEHQRAQLKAELHASRQAYDSMLGSTSWRITAPLRSMMKMFH